MNRAIHFGLIAFLSISVPVRAADAPAPAPNTDAAAVLAGVPVHGKVPFELLDLPASVAAKANIVPFLNVLVGKAKPAAAPAPAIQTGDIIVALDGRSLMPPSALPTKERKAAGLTFDAIAAMHPGQVAKFTVVRDGARRDIDVRIGGMTLPESASYEGWLAMGRDNYDNAAILFRAAAEQGEASAQYYLGGLYSEGRGVPLDDAQAVAWFRRAVEQNYPAAQFHLGFAYEWGTGVGRDTEQAIVWYRKAAAGGVELAQPRIDKLTAAGKAPPSR